MLEAADRPVTVSCTTIPGFKLEFPGLMYWCWDGNIVFHRLLDSLRRRPRRGLVCLSDLYVDRYRPRRHGQVRHTRSGYLGWYG